MYICSCHAVTDGAIRKAVKEGGIRRFRDLARATGVSTQCGICAKHAKEEFDKAIAALPAEEKAGKSAAVSAEFADEPKACAAGCVCTCGKKLDAE
jgi:bacterioferritin-associated ferredoxin